MLPRRACPCPPAQMNPPKDEQARSEDDDEQQSNDALQILGQFERLYESRVAEVEADPRITDPQRNELKLKIMTDWVKDLGEQNAMLVQTVHDLEQAAVCRVKLLENKLQATSNLISHNMSNSEKSEEDLNALTNRICHLTRDQNNMQKRIDCLQSDINNLLELIKRGRAENDWNLDRFTFYEIQPSDIPTLPDCTCNQDSIESREALSCELAQKQDAVLSLKRKLKCLEDQLSDSNQKLQCRDEVIYQLKEDLERNNEKDDKIRCLQEQLDELKSKLPSKNCVRLQDNKVATTKRVSISTDSSEKIESPSKDVSIENQHEVLAYLMNLKSSMEKDKEIIYNLKLEYETVLKSLRQTKNIYEQDVALVNEKLQDMKTCLCNYRSEVIEQDCTTDSITEFISTIEKKLVFIEKLFQNNCQKCVKENVQSEIKDIISKVISGTQKLSEIHENKCKITSSIQSMVSKSKPQCKQNINEEEQKAILEAICQQFRMMEEFRICTVEVQAATEDLREEVSEVICNLNSRHCKYVELNEMVNQLQDYLTKTKENMSEVINHLELQEEQRTRHSERITNNRIRLKDIKNEFNRTQSELSKCLNNVQNNIQNTNLLGYTEIHTCNDLIISVAEEVEELVNNIHNFQFQGCETLSSMTEVKYQLTTAEAKVKELKRKSEKILQENETAQKSFVEKFERLGKYECEVDNCHSKMQDVLESIISIRDQLNEFGCIQENENCYESTNDTIKLKEELRKSYKECEELKLKICQEPKKVDNEKNLLELENKVIDSQDQIQILKNEIKCKDQTNTFLKRSIDSLEKELLSIRAKAEDNRRCSSTECFELKKKIFELENLLRVQKDVENNLKCLVNNETDSKKSQLLDYAKDRHYDGSVGHGLSGANKNLSQLFKGLQETIQTTNNGIQEVTDNLKRLVPEGLSHSCCNTDNAIQAATESLAAYIESIKYCSIEVEKIKAALHSKNKLMENMDEIIRIQKDSITISQSEMEDVHKILQEKIDVQEKTIDHLEKEKSRLMQQNEFQVQTIGHLREAVVEAKKSIDQLTNKAASDVSEPWTPASSTIFNHSNVHDV